jgi:hypothetical protein
MKLLSGPKNGDPPPENESIALLVLNMYASSAKYLHAHLIQGATVSMLDEDIGDAVKLFENTCLGGHVIWINAEGVTKDALTSLQRHWFPLAGKAVVLSGAAQSSEINPTLQNLVSAKRENAAFKAVILTLPNTPADTTSRLMATQAPNWLGHITKDLNHPAASALKTLELLNLHRIEVPRVESAPLNAAPLPKPPDPQPNLQPNLQPDPQPDQVLQPTVSQGTSQMATLNDSMAACMQIDGAMAAALVDFGSGMALAKIGSGINLDMAAAGNTEVLKAKMKTAASLGIKDAVEDVLITLTTQYHLIRPVPHKAGLFMYLVLDKVKGNLAMARFKLMEIEKVLTV